MADNTRSHTLSRLEEAVTLLTQNQNTFTATQNSLHSRLDEALELRFAPTLYDDPRAALFKLSQQGSVSSYLVEFESLANRIVGLPTPFLLSCFISGLQPDIWREVLALQPLSLVQVVALACLHEDKLCDARRSSRPKPPSLSLPPTPQPLTTIHSPPLLPSPPKPTYKRLTQAEMASHRERGLCYHYDERYGPNHRCRAKFFLLIAPEDDDEPLPPESPDILEPNPTPPPPPDPDSAQFTLYALSGHPTSATLRVIGTIKGHDTAILMDGGSTHNFIHNLLAHFLNLTPQTIPALPVMVGNDTEIQCDKVCCNVVVSIQGCKFTLDLHVMVLGGTDIVLGVAWLKLLGPVTTDYSHLTMTFHHQGEPITIQGGIDSGPTEIHHGQVRCLINTNRVAALFHIQLHNHDPPSPNLPSTPPSLRSLLTKYVSLFQTLTILPPPRPTDHSIHLEPNLKPVNVRPYRYPYYQKREIERQVDDMLCRQLIRPSRSPYSSPVLLVKKKDGTWRFCVDYRALNSITVKDRFPLPTIDELLDDLGNSSWFLKMDLAQGFHQIRMEEHDISKTAFRTHQGHYEYIVMPFGLCNAPSIFQATMNELFRPFIRKFVLVFFDDILVYSHDFQAHINHLECVFKTLQHGQFHLKPSKCIFGQRRIEYLGHFVSSQGVEPDPSKINAMLQWPPPSTPK
ncbi:uncharacterized protein LOC114382700 [Glycine soja]|uniref:uncharacterized protein LOC114382700 n=1 Tax=Glycine soja TaxID=3848 RepID=UPI00103E9106|nr:uncharacterized protein LOC114382700 [Glycine soja]